MFSHKRVVAAITATTLMASSAFAADSAFAPGKPAGVKEAQQIGTGTLLIAGGAVAIAAVVAIVVSDQSGDRSNNLSTGTVSTGPVPSTGTV